jgi:hypothetical protein
VVFHDLSYELQQSTALYQTALSSVLQYLFIRFATSFGEAMELHQGEIETCL